MNNSLSFLQSQSGTTFVNRDSFVGGWVCLLLAFLVGWALSSSSLFLLFSLLVEEGSATSCFDLLTLTSSASTPLLSWLLTLAPRSWPCLLLLAEAGRQAGAGGGVVAAPRLCFLLLACLWVLRRQQVLALAGCSCPCCCCDHRGRRGAASQSIITALALLPGHWQPAQSRRSLRQQQQEPTPARAVSSPDCS